MCNLGYMENSKLSSRKIAWDNLQSVPPWGVQERKSSVGIINIMFCYKPVTLSRTTLTLGRICVCTETSYDGCWNTKEQLRQMTGKLLQQLERAVVRPFAVQSLLLCCHGRSFFGHDFCWGERSNNHPSPVSNFRMNLSAPGLSGSKSTCCLSSEQYVII